MKPWRAVVHAVRLSVGPAALGLAALTVAACATRAAPDAADTRQRPPMDTARMCEAHELMMTGSSPEEQQTMLEQHLKAMHGSVDPQMIARHRQAMSENCPTGARPAR